MKGTRVAMLLYGEIDHDARVIREGTALASAGYDVRAYSLAGARPPRKLPFEVQAVRPRSGLLPGAESPFRSGPRSRINDMIERARWLRGYARAFFGWQRTVVRHAAPADVWHGHDLFGLIAAWRLARRHGGSIVYDSHELFLEAGSAARLPSVLRRILAGIEGRLARRADAVITVNESIANELTRRYRVDPAVVMNCPPLPDAETGGVLRAATGLGERGIVMYHGALNPGRGVEQLVAALPSIDTGADVVLVGDGSLFDELTRLSRSPSTGGRLHVLPAVPVDELARWIADADVGVIAFQPIDRNNEYGTPNKLFEYLSVGVPVVVSDFPEMARIVNGADVGKTSDPTRPEAIADAINALLRESPADRAARRSRARGLAASRYNWELERHKLVSVYQSIAYASG